MLKLCRDCNNLYFFSQTKEKKFFDFCPCCGHAHNCEVDEQRVLRMIDELIDWGNDIAKIKQLLELEQLYLLLKKLEE
jgi:hypothetical protein